MQFGPSRGELWFRLVFSVAGLALLVFAIQFRGWPSGPGLVEVVGVSGLFFGGTLVMALRGLWRMRKAQEGSDAL